jgi:DNA-binding NarL/FixJ family response regulator
VLAEDDTLLREGLSLLLQGAGHDVAAAAPGPGEFLTAVARYRPDAAIVDVRMPPTHTDEGIRAAIQARRQRPELAVVVLSAYAEQSFATDLFAHGTARTGYLLKERVGRVSEFLAVLDRVAAGGTAIDPEVITQLLTRQRKDNPLERLSIREREVLALMAQGLGNRAIAERLFITMDSVHKHIRRIFMKLDLPPDDHIDRRVTAVLRFMNGQC